jgi:hypothetical protein
MTNGDVYTFNSGAECTTLPPPLEFHYLGNVFSGTVAVQGTNWSKIKSGYREESVLSLVEN